jgi:hypothetical protein
VLECGVCHLELTFLTIIIIEVLARSMAVWNLDDEVGAQALAGPVGRALVQLLPWAS